MTTFADQPLEEQIAQWRAYVRRRQGLHGPDVEELEGHLRDQLAALTEAGLTEDEAFLVAVKRMGNLDALSREFARAHSERLWKQLVMAPDADEPASTSYAETLVVLGLAVSAALAIKVPALFGIRLSPDNELPPFYVRNASLFVFPLLYPLLRVEAWVELRQRSLAGAAVRGRGCVRQRLLLPHARRH
jgi:hypothetical protein